MERVVTTALVTCAAVLFEGVPFILAGALLAHAFRKSAWMVPYLGCGCTAGPSARSLPAAVAACMVFGPLTAAARLLAAAAVARMRPREAVCGGVHFSPLGELCALLGPAIAAACAAPLWPAMLGKLGDARADFALGAGLALTSAPCGLGAVAVASALRHSAPLAAAGFLSVAGICDLRAVMHSKAAPGAHHDMLAYLLAGAACANAAAHHGAGLVHPLIAAALWICAAIFGVCAFRYRDFRRPIARIAPAVMLAGSMLAAPLPQYHATETTLSGAFPGERLDFTGMVTRTGSVVTLVRYAIVCCRADASPVVLRLAHAPRRLQGWVHARGVLVQDGAGLTLHADRLRQIAAPADPFVYR